MAKRTAEKVFNEIMGLIDERIDALLEDRNKARAYLRTNYLSSEDTKFVSWTVNKRDLSNMASTAMDQKVRRDIWDYLHKLEDIDFTLEIIMSLRREMNEV